MELDDLVIFLNEFKKKMRVGLFSNYTRFNSHPCLQYSSSRVGATPSRHNIDGVHRVNDVIYEGEELLNQDDTRLTGDF